MKRTNAALTLGLALLLPGCVVTSLHPFYTSDDLVFEPALLGSWMAKDSDDASQELMEFTRHQDQTYLLAPTKKAEPEEKWVVSLFKLGDQHFLDLFPAQGSSGPDFVAVHRVMKFSFLTNTIELVEMKYEWLGKLLESDPAAVRHEVIQEPKGPDGKENRRIVLTASTKELQDLLRRNVSNPEAWDESSELKRYVAPAPGTKPASP